MKKKKKTIYETKWNGGINGNFCKPKPKKKKKLKNNKFPNECC